MSVHPLLLAVLLVALPLNGCTPSQQHLDPDAGPMQPDAGSASVCHDARVLGDHAAFTFDARGVGHSVYVQSGLAFVTSTQPDAVPRALPATLGASSATHITVDAQGARHLLFRSTAGTTYADERSGAWQSVAVGEGVPRDLEVDPHGFAHVLLIRSEDNHTRHQLRYASNASGAWHVTWLDDVWEASDVDLGVDSQGGVHVAYASAQDGATYYATRTAGGWSVERVDAHSQARLHLRLDAAGKPYLLREESPGALRLSVKEPGGWQHTVIAQGNGRVEDVRLDAAGALHLLLVRDTSPIFVHATYAAGAWSEVSLASLEAPPRERPWEGVLFLWAVLALDDAHQPVVAYAYRTGRGAALSLAQPRPCP